MYLKILIVRFHLHSQNRYSFFNTGMLHLILLIFIIGFAMLGYRGTTNKYRIFQSKFFFFKITKEKLNLHIF